MKWLPKEDTRGTVEMGYYHFEGCGSVEQDYAKAVQWFEKAYENPKCSDVTKTQAAAYLGICCQDGLGVVQDDDAALEYLQEVEERMDDLWVASRGRCSMRWGWHTLSVVAPMKI